VRLFEALFSHPAEIFEAGELVWRSPLPAFVWPAIGLAAAVVVVLSQGTARARGPRDVRGLAVAALQLCMLVLLLALLAEPFWRVRRVEAGRNSLVLLIDHSQSMSFAEGGDTRLDRALTGFRERAFARVRASFSLESYAFAERLKRVESIFDPAAFGATTALRSSLTDALSRARDAGAAALVLISDGRENRTGGASGLGYWLRELSSFGVPVHVIAAGPERIANDVRLVDAALPERAVRGTRVPVDVSLQLPRAVTPDGSRASGAAATPVRVVVREQGRPLASREVELTSGGSVERARLEFEISDAGVHDLEIAVDPLPGETQRENNVARALLEVPAKPRRVLYVEGEPRWEYKFLRRALAGDPGLSLVTLLFTTQSKTLRQGIDAEEELRDGFPARAEDLFRYDALVIGSLEASSLTPDQHRLIERFVRERGGGLLLLAGPRGLGAGGWGATSLRSVLPAALPSGDAATLRRSPGVIEPTRYGFSEAWLELATSPDRNRELWRSLPDVSEAQTLGPLKLGAIALLQREEPNGEKQPALALQGYGRGRAALFGAGATWRWHMGTAAEDGRHARFWRQLLRFLASEAEPPVRAWIEPLKRPLAPGDASQAASSTQASSRLPSSRLRVEVRNEAFAPIAATRVEARIETDGAPTRTLELVPAATPGMFEAVLALEPDALHRIALELRGPDVPSAARELVIHHRSPPAASEAFDATQDRALLEQIALATDGRVWDGEALSELPAALAASPRSITRFEEYDLRFMPVVLIALLLLRATEWALRKRWGWV